MAPKEVSHSRQRLGDKDGYVALSDGQQAKQPTDMALLLLLGRRRLGPSCRVAVCGSPGCVKAPFRCRPPLLPETPPFLGGGSGGGGGGGSGGGGGGGDGGGGGGALTLSVAVLQLAGICVGDGRCIITNLCVWRGWGWWISG